LQVVWRFEKHFPILTGKKLKPDRAKTGTTSQQSMAKAIADSFIVPDQPISEAGTMEVSEVFG
jgi:hypothetical protein